MRRVEVPVPPPIDAGWGVGWDPTSMHCIHSQAGSARGTNSSGPRLRFSKPSLARTGAGAARFAQIFG